MPQGEGWHGSRGGAGGATRTSGSAGETTALRGSLALSLTPATDDNTETPRRSTRHSTYVRQTIHTFSVAANVRITAVVARAVAHSAVIARVALGVDATSSLHAHAHALGRSAAVVVRTFVISDEGKE